MMFARNLLLKQNFFLINQEKRKFGFLLSKTTSSSKSSKNNGELDSLLILLEKLKTKKLDSKIFFQKAEYTYTNLTSSLSQNKNILLAQKVEQDIGKFCCLMIDCMKYVNNQQILNIFKMIESGIQQSNYDKEALVDLMKWITFTINQDRISHQDIEYYCKRIYELLNKIKKRQSFNLYLYLLETNKYHEIFEQEYVETIDKILFDNENKIKFYNENIIESDYVRDFIAIIQTKKELHYLAIKFSDLFNTSALENQTIGNNSTECSSIEEQFSHLDSPNNKLSKNVFQILKHFNILSENQKEIILNDVSNKIDFYFNNEDNITIEDLHKFIELIYLLKGKSSKKQIIASFSKMMNFFQKNLDQLEQLEFPQLLFLTINSGLYLPSSRSNNITYLALIKCITNQLNSITSIVKVLPVLLNYGIVPNELINKLSTLDVSNRTNFSNIQMIYYINTYVRLYSKVSGYNKIIFNGLKTIDELLEKIHSRFTFEEKCTLVLQIKDFSSHNKNFYFIKPIIEQIDKIPQKYFAGVINNLINSCYFLLNYELLVSEILKRWDLLDHKDLVLIGKALIWINFGDFSFWTKFFRKLEHSFASQNNFENVIWVCNLHQIIFSLRLYYPELYQTIISTFKKINFEKIEKSYFERPNLITTEELTKSEFEIEQFLREMNLPYERQITIGIHRVDFVIKPTLIVELYGRHHFTERNVLNGASLWREKQLNKLGYQIVGIILQDWNELMTTQKKKGFLEEKLNIQKSSKPI